MSEDQKPSEPSLEETPGSDLVAAEKAPEAVPSSAVSSNIAGEIAPPSPGDLVEALQKLPKIQLRELDYTNVSTDPEELGALLGASDAPVSLAKDPLVIYIRDRAFISSVEIKGNKALPDNVRIEYLDLNDQWKLGRLVTSNKAVSVEIASNAKALRISRSAAVFRKNVSIERVEVYGFAPFGSDVWQENFETFIEQVEICEKEFRQREANISLAQQRIDADRKSNQESIDRDREDLSKEKTSWQEKLDGLKAEQLALQASIDAKKSEQAQASAAAGVAAGELAVQTAMLTEVTSKKDAAEKRHSDLEKLITEKTSSSASLDGKIADMKIELDRLNNDAALFATNLKDYGKKGQKQAETYLLLVLLCVLLGYWATITAFGEVDNIWGVILKDPKGISWSLIAITRFSIFIIFASVIGALSTLAYTFIRRTMEIHDRSLRLSEISILAKDTIDATLSDTNTAPEQKVTVFYATRMTLIRNLLSGTFEKITKISNQERDELNADFKLSDIQGIKNALLLAGLDLGTLKKKS